MKITATLAGLVALSLCGSAAAFAGQLPLRAVAWRSSSRVAAAAAGAVCAVAPHGGNPGGALGDAAGSLQDGLHRRAFLAASVASVVGAQRAAVAADDDMEAGSPDEVVVEGELRLEEGADKKFSKGGGKGRAEVVLRCVGKGVISKTTEEVDLADFPVTMLVGRFCQSGRRFGAGCCRSLCAVALSKRLTVCWVWCYAACRETKGGRRFRRREVCRQRERCIFRVIGRIRSARTHTSLQ